MLHTRDLRPGNFYDVLDLDRSPPRSRGVLTIDAIHPKADDDSRYMVTWRWLRQGGKLELKPYWRVGEWDDKPLEHFRLIKRPLLIIEDLTPTDMVTDSDRSPRPEEASMDPEEIQARVNAVVDPTPAISNETQAALARDLYQLHLRTGLSLDKWTSARDFVEAFYGPIENNNV